MKINYLLIITLFFALFSCKNEQNNTSSEIENHNTNRQEQINLIREYVSKSKEKITDSDGFPITYDFEQTMEIVKKIGKSKVISSNFNGYDNSVYLELLVGKFLYTLKVNGKIKAKIPVLAQVYDFYQLNPFLLYKSPTNYSNGRKIFLPELDKTSYRKEIISKITKPKFFNPLGLDGQEFKKLRDNWNNEVANTIKKTNFFDFKTIKDLEEIKVQNSVKLEPNNPEDSNPEDLNIEKNDIDIVKQYFNITVDNLRVRTSPNLDSEKIENLAIGSKVNFIEKSNNQTTVTIKNNQITEYWYKVETPTGNIGWIHGCCFDK